MVSDRSNVVVKQTMMYSEHEEVFCLPIVTRLRPYVHDQVLLLYVMLGAKEMTGSLLAASHLKYIKTIRCLSKSIYQKRVLGKAPRTKGIQNIQHLNQKRMNHED